MDRPLTDISSHSNRSLINNPAQHLEHDAVDENNNKKDEGKEDKKQMIEYRNKLKLKEEECERLQAQTGSG